MNYELTTKLSLIRAECRKAIELGEKATPGPWREGTNNVWQDDLLIPVSGMERRHDYSNGRRYMIAEKDRYLWEQADAASISHSRTFSPAAARAVLGLMDALENILGRNESNDAHESFLSLQTLIDQWPNL